MLVLTPSGYKSIEDVAVGDELSSFDTVTGAPIVNTLLKKELVTDATYSHWTQDSDGNNVDYVPDTLTAYLVNGTYTLCKYQSVWDGRAPLGQVTHADDLSVGDTLFSDTNGDIAVTSISETTVSSWWRLHVSGDASFIADGLILHNASRYWNYQHTTGTDKTWAITAPTNWGSASNTADGASVPGSADDVFFDGVGGGNNTSTLSANITINSFDFTGYASTLTHNSSVTLTCAGNGVTAKFVSGMTYTLGSATTSALSFTGTSGTTTLTSGTKTVGNVTFNGVGGTWSLGDALTSSGTLTLTNGTFTDNGNALTVGLLASSNSNTRVLTGGSVTWTVNSSGTVFNFATTTNLTWTAPTTIDFSYSGASARTFSNASTAGTPVSLNTFKVSAGSGTFTITSGGSGSKLTTPDFDLSGFSGTFANGTSPMTMSGNFKLGTGCSTTGSTQYDFTSTSTGKTVTFNGATLTPQMVFNGVGGGWTFQDDVICSGSFTLTNGNVNTNGKNVTSTLMSGSNSNTRTLTIDNSTWTLTGSASGAIWNFTTVTNLTFSATGSTIKLTDTGATGQTFAGGGKTFGTLWFSGGATTKVYTITGSNTFADIKNTGTTGAFTIKFTAATTQTTAGWHVSGTSGNLVIIDSTTTATHALTLTGGGTVSADYLNIQHSVATPGTLTWYAGVNSTNNQAVATAGSGWIFTAPPAASNGNFLMFF